LVCGCNAGGSDLQLFASDRRSGNPPPGPRDLRRWCEKGAQRADRGASTARKAEAVDCEDAEGPGHHTRDRCHRNARPCASASVASVRVSIRDGPSRLTPPRALRLPRRRLPGRRRNPRRIRRLCSIHPCLTLRLDSGRNRKPEYSLPELTSPSPVRTSLFAASAPNPEWWVSRWIFRSASYGRCRVQKSRTERGQPLCFVEVHLHEYAEGAPSPPAGLHEGVVLVPRKQGVKRRLVERAESWARSMHRTEMVSITECQKNRKHGSSRASRIRGSRTRCVLFEEARLSVDGGIPQASEARARFPAATRDR
jgi:hypothetical protein